MPIIRKALEQTEPFRQLDAEILDLIAQGASVREAKPGEVLMRRGAKRAALFLIIAGRVDVHIGDSESDATSISFANGDALGEEGLLGEGRHAATARVIEPTQLVEMPLDDLRNRMAEHGAAALAIVQAVARLMVRRLQYASFRRVGWENIYESGRTRTESDLVGPLEVPANARYGVQTMRAVHNFPITGIRIAHFACLIEALAAVKQAAARANHELGLLDDKVAGAIDVACQEIIEGHWHGHFVVDMVQGGAGTSTNMNANEVIANRALELLGHPCGAYTHCHPNNHVNLSQSTNDAYPTAVRVAAYREQLLLADALRGLVDALRAKAIEFADVIKMGRTQLQDAVPMTMGQEFEAYAVTVEEDVLRLTASARLLMETNLGGTAIGTGLNAHPKYRHLVLKALQDITGLPLVSAPNLIEATPDTGAFVHFSGVLKRVAVKISKICNDLRLLSSGPRAGFGEIRLPAMQPGSSIMPGKVNPVIPEVVNQVAFHVIGNDLTITLAAEAGQLQLNVMEPIIAWNLFESISMMTAAVQTLTKRCIRGIEADRDRCRELVENSVGIVTAIVPLVGYDRASTVAKEALNSDLSVREILIRDGDLDAGQIDELLSPDAMV